MDYIWLYLTVDAQFVQSWIIHDCTSQSTLNLYSHAWYLTINISLHLSENVHSTSIQPQILQTHVYDIYDTTLILLWHVECVILWLTDPWGSQICTSQWTLADRGSSQSLASWQQCGSRSHLLPTWGRRGIRKLLASSLMHTGQLYMT